MPVPPITRDTITAALVEFGPMSVLEIMEATGFGRQRVNSCLNTARHDHPRTFFKIVDYQRNVGVQGREIPIYAAGPGRDALRPAFKKKESQHAYYLRNRARVAVRRKSNAGYATPNPWAGLLPMQTRRPTPPPQPA